MRMIGLMVIGLFGVGCDPDDEAVANVEVNLQVDLGTDTLRVMVDGENAGTPVVNGSQYTWLDVVDEEGLLVEVWIDRAGGGSTNFCYAENALELGHVQFTIDPTQDILQGCGCSTYVNNAACKP